MSKIDTDQVEGIGDLTALTTSNKTDIVRAINEVNGKAISSTPMTTISTGVGWYRIATANGAGTAGKSFIVIVERFYNQSNNESYTFSINTAHNGVSTITQISGIANFRAISEIRVVNELGSNVFVDIFYLTSSINNVRVTVIGNGASALSPTIAPLPTGDVVSLLTTNGIRTTNNIVTDTGFFIKGKSNTDIVLANGDTKPISDFQNNYLDSIITTNGTTAGTVYTFKRVGLSDLTLTLTAASDLFSGVVTIGNQTFEGIKTFLKSPKVPAAINSDEAVNKGQLDAVSSNIPIEYARRGGSGNLRSLATNDTRTTDELPSTDLKNEIRGDFKNGDIFGLSIGERQGTLTVVPWENNTGNDNTAFRLLQRGGVLRMQYYYSGAWNAYVTFYHTGNFNPAQYVMISALNTTLAGYATLAGTQTFTGQNTFTQAPIVPNGTLNGHTVNLGQLNTILSNYALASAIPTNNNQLTNGAGYITASALGGYVQQTSLNTQLANYVTLGSVQTITATKTFTVSPIVPNGTLAGHTVNLGQMQAYVASQIPGNSGIERIQTDNSTNPGPAEQPTLYFNFHEYMGMPETDTLQDLPGNMTARASGHQLDFFGSYDNKETIIEDAPFALDFPEYRKHIIDLHLTTAGDVYVADGMFTGDQVNIVTHRGAQINLDGNIHFLNAVGAHEFFSFVNLEWDASAKMWNVTAFN